MTRAIPGVVRPAQAGATVVMSAPTVNGDAIPPGAFLLVTNGSAGTITLTFTTPGTVGNNLAIADQTATVAAATTAVFGPFADQHFRQTAGTTANLVHVDYSAVASVTRAVIQP